MKENINIKVYSGQAKTKESTSKLGYVYQCTGCEMMEFQRLGRVTPHENGKNLKYTLPGGPPVGQKCEHCESGFHMGGPIWLDPIHDQLFVAQLLQSIQVSRTGAYECRVGNLRHEYRNETQYRNPGSVNEVSIFVDTNIFLKKYYFIWFLNTCFVF